MPAIKQARPDKTLVVDLGEKGKETVSYKLDGQFCNVFIPDERTFERIASGSTSKIIAAAVKTAEQLDREPLVVFHPPSKRARK